MERAEVEWARVESYPRALSLASCQEWRGSGSRGDGLEEVVPVHLEWLRSGGGALEGDEPARHRQSWLVHQLPWVMLGVREMVVGVMEGRPKVYVD